MATDRSIKQYNQTTTTETGSAVADKDGILLQRGSGYFFIDPVDLRLGIQKVTLTITEAEIEALNTTEIEIISAPGAGKYIQILSHSYLVREVGSAYTSNTNVRCKYSTDIDANYLITWNAILALTAKTIKDGDTSANPAREWIEDDAVNVFVPTGDPGAAGTGSIIITLFYRIVDA